MLNCTALVWFMLCLVANFGLDYLVDLLWVLLSDWS